MARPRPRDKDTLGETLDLFLLVPAAAFAAFSFLAHIQQINTERGLPALQTVYEAYRDACAFDLLSEERNPDESPSPLLAAGASEACESGKVVCFSGKLLPAGGTYKVPIHGEIPENLGSLGPNTTEALKGTRTEALAFTAIGLYEQGSSSGDRPIKLPEGIQEMGKLVPCTMSGAVAVDPNQLEPRLRPSFSNILEAWPSSPFRTSDALPLPRAAHSYTDFFLGRKLKAMFFYVPSALRCLLVGRLVIDGGKLTLTAHPWAGFHLGFRGSPRAWLDDLIVAALAPLQQARGDVQGWADARGASLACAGVLAGAWAVRRLFVAASRLFPPPTPPPTPPPLPPPSSMHSQCECGICLEPYSSGAVPGLVPRLLPSCGHTFCSGCLANAGLSTCPICRVLLPVPAGGKSRLDLMPRNFALLDCMLEPEAERAVEVEVG